MPEWPLYSERLSLGEVINFLTHNNDQYLYIFAQGPTFSPNVKAMKIQKMISKS